jgi:hypothetical protein
LVETAIFIRNDGKGMPQGLSRLREKAQLRAKSRKDIEQGLKPDSFNELYRPD